jgi:hypothetical protein
MVTKSDITKAYINTAGRSETASGKIMLAYENEDNKKVFRIDYKNVHDPEDGSGRLIITDNPGDMIQLKNGEFEEVPRFVIKQAKDTLSKYLTEARKGKGAKKNGGVVFTGFVGNNDNWLPN